MAGPDSPRGDGGPSPRPAGRAPPTAPPPAERDRRLAREGWRRRFVAGPHRLREVTELYERLGHEVRLERPSDEELPAACRGCALPGRLHRILYTRRRP